jgi:hypothetical protein
MRRTILGAAVAACFSTGAAGFDPKDASYFCTAEISAGLAFDKSVKNWDSKTFRADGKFTLRMKYLNSRRVTYGGEDFVVGDFEVTITNAGSNNVTACNTDFGEKPRVTTVNQFDLFNCNVHLMNYLISVRTNRFLQTYTGQYVQADETRTDNPDTPSVTGGKCMKIE